MQKIMLRFWQEVINLEFINEPNIRYNLNMSCSTEQKSKYIIVIVKDHLLIISTTPELKVYNSSREMSENLPLCSPRKTNLNFRRGLPKSPDVDMVIYFINIKFILFNPETVFSTEFYHKTQRTHWLEPKLLLLYSTFKPYKILPTYSVVSLASEFCQRHTSASLVKLDITQIRYT